jgi:hypothetical protein
MTSLLSNIFLVSSLIFVISQPINKGDFNIDQSAKWA